MIVSIDTTQPLSDKDRLILGILSDGAVVNFTEQASAATKTEAPAKAEKAAPAKVAEPAAETPAASDGPTVEDAVKVAMELVAEGKSSLVKEIVATLTAPKVSELQGDEIALFLQKVEEAKEAESAI